MPVHGELAAPAPRLAEAEFVTLIALLISMVALGIDTMLPALPVMGDDLGVDGNAQQAIISLFFLGLGLGQMIWGPLSDTVGRKRAIYGGMALFMAGSVLSALTGSFVLMLLGRMMQGFGAAAPRIVVIAMVRDQYAGAAMARIMSTVMAVFIVIPAAAPALGQGIIAIAHWRAIFALFFGMAVIASVWLALRQPETLTPARRRRFSFHALWRSIIEVMRNRVAAGYMLAASFVFSAFVGYLVTAQQIFQDLYGVGDLFALYFAVLALAIGASSLANGRLVARYRMATLSRVAAMSMVAISGLFLAYDLAVPGPPPLWLFMAAFTPLFFAVGIMFGNLNALAMEPMGHIAGTAAAVIGSMTTLVSMVMGSLTGALYHGTLTPLLAGFAVFGSLSLGCILWAGRGK
ncbi:Bcr/CflA family efflux MFS transporter [Roseovarius spongiae]|uniref:Bcr/CflA family efflux transporter n=2 Tax=Roseovarius spongiae TaxID=2320272 RepID=A0A3A8B859_9RHOB|nr:Bcr/CflA family efflux MFS transporter [Roseovarius spongiae]